MHYHRDILCQIRRSDFVPLPVVEKSGNPGDPPDLVRIAVEATELRTFVVSWQSLIPINAICKVYKCSPIEKYATLVARTYMKRDDLATQNRSSDHHRTNRLRSFSSRTNSVGIIIFELFKVEHGGDPAALSGADVDDYYTSTSSLVRRRITEHPHTRPFVTFQFELVKSLSGDDDSHMDDESQTCSQDGELLSIEPRAQPCGSLLSSRGIIGSRVPVKSGLNMYCRQPSVMEWRPVQQNSTALHKEIAHDEEALEGLRSRVKAEALAEELQQLEKKLKEIERRRRGSTPRLSQ